MPAKSKVLSLPKPVREELDARLVASGFQGYEELSAWLIRQGFEISKSTVHRYGQTFEEKLSLLQLAGTQAKAVVEAVGDDAGAMGEALTAGAQEKAFQVLMDLSAEDVDVPLDKLISSVARLNSASVQQKKWATEVRARAEAAASDVDDVVRKSGLSDEAAAQIRSKILGIAA